MTVKRANTILAAAFLAVLFGLAGYTLSDCPAILADLTAQWENREDKTDSSLLAKLEFSADRAEGLLNAALDREHHFIRLYGALQRLTGQRFVEDNYSYSVIRLNNGTLTFGSVAQEQKDTGESARATAEFAAALGDAGIPFSAVITPQKVPQGVDCVPAALKDFHNEEADQFLSLLDEAGLHTVDLRDDMGSDLTSYFYRTDHHWNAHGAFFGNCLMTAALSGRYGFTPFEPGLNAGRFSRQTYENLFLGSQGKRVGPLYAGTDDFVLYSPEFPTNLTYQISDTALPRTGTLDESLYFKEHLVQDYFTANPYVTFAGGDHGKATVTNHLNPDGPSVVMIRDSFGCAITPFFALQCSRLVTVDLRAYRGEDLLADIADIDPDFVVLLYSPSSTVSDGMFDFS